MTDDWVIAAAEREIAVVRAECRRELAAATARAERAEAAIRRVRELDENNPSVPVPAADPVWQQGWAWGWRYAVQAVGRALADVAGGDAKSERAEAAIERVRALATHWAADFYLQDEGKAILAALDGTDNTGGTDGD